MHPSNPSSHGGSRVGSVMYAHSPYVYRTTVEDAPVSPMSDQGRGDPCSVPTFYSPRSLSQSTGNVDNNSLSGMGKGTMNNNGSQYNFHSQPSSPLRRSTTGQQQEYSQPIQVGSAPNVHPRFRRGMQSPLAHPGNESGGRSGLPSSPSGSLPPRSPFIGREDSTSTFSGGESAPVRGLNNPYRMNAGTGLSAPQSTMPLSGSYRGGNNTNAGNDGGNGTGSGPQSPAPYHARRLGGDVGGTPLQLSTATGSAPAYSSSNVNNNSTSVNSNSYAPAGFSMPPAMATIAGVHSGGGSSFHSPLSGCAGLQSGSFVDPHSSHLSSPLIGVNGRPPMGCSPHNRFSEPITPTYHFSSGSYGHNNNTAMSPDSTAYSPNSNCKGSNGAPPPAFATAMLQQQQQSCGYAVGSFPARRGAPPTHPSTPFTNHMNLSASGADPSQISASYGTNTKTLSSMADDTVSSSGKSSSSASSIRDDLPLCPNDDACTAINDRKHQKKYAHTCRLFPCYHGHVTRHAKLFRHAPGQISLPEGLTAGARVSSHALASVNFITISPEAPNAYRIYVSHGDRSYEIFGDWASVKVHTFKRYLHQVYHIPPGSQILSVMKTGKVMDDDINTVKCYGIEEDSVIQLRSDIEDAPSSGKLRIPLDDL